MFIEDNLQYTLLILAVVQFVLLYLIYLAIVNEGVRIFTILFLHKTDRASKLFKEEVAQILSIVLYTEVATISSFMTYNFLKTYINK